MSPGPARGGKGKEKQKSRFLEAHDTGYGLESWFGEPAAGMYIL